MSARRQEAWRRWPVALRFPSATACGSSPRRATPHAGRSAGCRHRNEPARPPRNRCRSPMRAPQPSMRGLTCLRKRTNARRRSSAAAQGPHVRTQRWRRKSHESRYSAADGRYRKSDRTALRRSLPTRKLESWPTIRADRNRSMLQRQAPASTTPSSAGSRHPADCEAS